MRGLGYVIALGVLLAGSAAQANPYIGVGGVGNSAVRLNGTWDNYDDLGEGFRAFKGFGGSTSAEVKITADSAAFQSGVAVAGPNAQARSTSGVDVTIFNGSESDVVGLSDFHSTITPAGMGFYLADRSGTTPTNIFTDYGQTTEYGWSDVYDQVGSGVEIGRVGFYFDVYGDEGGEFGPYNPYQGEYAQGSLYTLSGYLALSFDGGGNLVYDLGGLAAAQAVLAETFTTAWDTNQALGFAWGETDVLLTLNKLLNPGDYTNLYYRTSVYAESNFGCLTGTTVCLASYSGFGDPIGRGGGLSRSARGGATLASDDCDPTTQMSLVCGIVFDPTTVKPITFTATINPGSGGVVPEPATWALLIMGFGLSGAALRRRRMLSYS